MAPLPWLYMLEQMAYRTLVRSPTFNRAVEQVVKGVHRVRYGPADDELGGTKMDQPGFGQHFLDELNQQAKFQRVKEEGKVVQKAPQSPEEHDQGAEAVWRAIQRGEQPVQRSVDEDVTNKKR